jgi:thiol-disulfide isomerase/thioredoxin
LFLAVLSEIHDPGCNLAKLSDTGLVGTQAPDFVSEDVRGEKVSLSQLKGKLVLIHFWATWCGPCLEELPVVEAVQRDYGHDGVVVVGVNLDDDIGKFREFIKNRGILYTQVSDRRGTVRSAYRVYSIPRWFLTDVGGTIVAQGTRGNEMLEAVQQAVRKRNKEASQSRS